MKIAYTRHIICIILGWIVGPYLSSWWIELLVATGVRMNFTVWDWVFRLVAIGALEVVWPFAAAFMVKTATPTVKIP